MASRPQIALTFPAGGVPSFSLLLQSGFVVAAARCGSIRSFLVDELGMTPEFIEGVIQSIFLDGKPVDDIDSVAVKDGCILALSAAMPGLVGATMRRGGFYASLRSGISCQADDQSTEGTCGEITVKLFNLIASELGPAMLAQGLCVRREHLGEFFGSRSEDFWTRCKSVKVDGEPRTSAELRAMEGNGELVSLVVETS